MTASNPLTGRKIHTYTPTEPGRKCLALIEGFPGIFRGPTPFGAMQAAKRFAAAIDAKKPYEVKPEEQEDD